MMWLCHLYLSFKRSSSIPSFLCSSWGGGLHTTLFGYSWLHLIFFSNARTLKEQRSEGPKSSAHYTTRSLSHLKRSPHQERGGRKKKKKNGHPSEDFRGEAQNLGRMASTHRGGGTIVTRPLCAKFALKICLP